MKNWHRVWLGSCAVLCVATVLYVCGCERQSKQFSAQGLTTGQPGLNVYSKAAPGESTVLPRLYKNAPPQIPHDIAGLAITRENNDCLTCHLEGIEASEGHHATKIPASHFVNPYSKEMTKEFPTGTRYQCLQCHAPQSAEEPPVPQA